VETFSEIRRVAWLTIAEAFGLDVTDTATMIFQAPTYTVLTLPAAATYPRGIIYVSDQSTGAELAFSDGTNWRIFSTRAIVS
jgi:hypothetical protein